MRRFDKQANDKPWWALWTVLLTSPVFLLAVHFGYQYRGMAAWIFMMLIGVALAANWSSRKNPAFWISGVVLVLIHIVVVILLPWPKWKMNGPEFMPFGLLDFLCNFALIRYIVFATNRRRGTSRV